MAEMRLQRYLSQSGVASRRKAETLIVNGVVSVNGKVVRELGTKVSDGDSVTVNGNAVYPLDLFYCVLNKPKGCLCTVSDPDGRPTVMEYLPKLPVPVVPVGRLDFNSEGVLLLTNDGELSAALQAPQGKVEKTYHVKVRGSVTDREIDMMRDGIVLDDGRKTRPAQIDRLKHKSRHDWLVITLTEGRNRQIHRMLEALGHSATKIQRLAFAGITFYGMRVGDARELTPAEVKQLRTLVGVKANPRATPRGTWTTKREDTELSRRAHKRIRDEAAEAAEGAETGAMGNRDGERSASGGRSSPRPDRGGARGSQSAGKPRKSGGRVSRDETTPRERSESRGRPSRGGRVSTGGKPSGRGRTASSRGPSSSSRGGKPKSGATRSGGRSSSKPGKGRR